MALLELLADDFVRTWPCAFKALLGLLVDHFVRSTPIPFEARGLHPLKLDEAGVLVRLLVFREIDGSKRAVAAGDASLVYGGGLA